MRLGDDRERRHQVIPMHDDRERELFEASLKLPAEERSEYVRRECGDDRELETRRVPPASCADPTRSRARAGP
jgi:hypothetical protein